MMEDNSMKIGEIAKRLGTTQRTLRFYEEQGLIKPGRSAKGTRYYSAEDVERVTVILRMAEVGVPLAQIRRVASLFPVLPDSQECFGHVQERLHSLAEQMAEQQRQLAALENELHEVRTHLNECLECSAHSQGYDKCHGCDKHHSLNQQPLMRLLRHAPVETLQ